jgi:xanthine dehydrogenase accessory factor
VGRRRILHAPVAGRLTVLRDIGDPGLAGEPVARIGTHTLPAPIGGTLCGILRHGMAVEVGDKLLAVDPRPADRAIFTGIGERPARIAAGVARATCASDLRQAVARAPASTVPDLSGPNPAPGRTP